jgi:hypothetical protein
MRRDLLVLAVAVFGWFQPPRAARAAEYQWSALVEPSAAEPAKHPRAFLWIPPTCTRVRAVVVGQNNMIEEGIFAHPDFRAALSQLGMAEVWVAPPFDGVFDFNQGAGDRFDAMMKSLATESGYTELAFAPVVPIGHSACASYPWNFAAWNPGRTLAILSVHGDAPLTPLTGSGHPNPHWGDRRIDGVPGLMVMGEYEWMEDRLLPALKFRREHPKIPLCVLAEPGRGHFDYADGLVKFLAMFIRQAAAARLPMDGPLDQPPILRPVDPAKGWLVERWHLDQPRKIPPAPADKYTGDPGDAFWAFDQECAEAVQHYRADQVGKKPQLLGFVQDGKVVPQIDVHEQVRLRFEPEPDGVTFHVHATFLDTVDGGSHNPPRSTGLPGGSPLGHATGGGLITVTRIAGPVVQMDADTFRLSLNRASVDDKRAHDIWLLASQPGDAEYKSAVQQALMRASVNTAGAGQHITFPEILDQKAGAKTVALKASSDAGGQVHYYVREGPAEIDGDTLHLTPLPPRSRLPVKVTVVAWAWGHSSEPKLQTAEPVVRTFSLVR